jgi:hypothetical protein
MDRTTSTLLEGGTSFEGPRWHEGCWWVPDVAEEARSAARPCC